MMTFQRIGLRCWRARDDILDDFGFGNLSCLVSIAASSDADVDKIARTSPRLKSSSSSRSR